MAAVTDQGREAFERSTRANARLDLGTRAVGGDGPSDENTGAIAAFEAASQAAQLQQQMMLKNREELRLKQQLLFEQQLELERQNQHQEALKNRGVDILKTGPSGSNRSLWPPVPMWAKVTVAAFAAICYVFGLIPFVNLITTPLFWLIKISIYFFAAPHVFSLKYAKYLGISGGAFVLDLIPFINYIPWSASVTVLDFINRNPITAAVKDTVIHKNK